MRFSVMLQNVHYSRKSLRSVSQLSMDSSLVAVPSTRFDAYIKTVTKPYKVLKTKKCEVPTLNMNLNANTVHGTKSIPVDETTELNGLDFPNALHSPRD